MTLPVWNPNISLVCAHRDWFTVNFDYQREPEAWTPADKQYLIDTVVKDLDIPKFYIRKLSDKKYEIVDGQQRLTTIWEFRDNKFALSGKISGDALDGKRYAELPADVVEKFDNFRCILLATMEQDKIDQLFCGKFFQSGDWH